MVGHDLIVVGASAGGIGGILLQMPQGEILRFRRHTGHAFSMSSLLAEVTASIECVLWDAARGIDESLLLLGHLAHHAEERHDHSSAAYIRQKVQDAENRRALVQRASMGQEQFSVDSLHRPPDTE